MWTDIISEFSDSPSQSRVVRFLLENGLGVNESGRVVCNGLAIPATQVARAVGVDRRVVDATAQRILDVPALRDVFTAMRATPDLSGVAEKLGLVVITLYPVDAHRKGIVENAVRVVVEHDLRIRQIFVTDPELSEDPKLVMIVDGPVPPTLYGELRALPDVRSLII
ncbi:MAG: regulator of amino acid metabolism, contains ACT domain protein [Methanoculleaceae archaeon]